MVDIWDHTQLKPLRDAFARKLDFAGLKTPNDPFAAEIGQRWYKESGGEELHNEAGIDMDTYWEADPEKAEDRIQIDKDLKRTKAASMTSPSLKAFLAQMDPEATKKIMNKVLSCFCRRNRKIGYAQGLDFIVLFLIAFQSAEKAFWTLCGMVETILPSDFYDPPPAMMNGFLVERALLCELACLQYPRIVRHVGQQQLCNVMELMSPKWLITMFVDCVSLEVSCMLFTSLFHHKGQEGVIPVVLTILGQIQKSVLKGDQDLLMAVVSKSKTIRPKLVKLGLQNKTYHCFNPAKVEDIRNRARKALAARWNQTNSSQLYEITHATSFGIDQLEAFQNAFRGIYKKRKQGISKKVFTNIIQSSAVHMNKEIIERFFELYDTDKRSSLNFCELMCCMSALCAGSVQDKMRMCFNVYDLDHSGFLNHDEIQDMSVSLMKMIGHPEFSDNAHPSPQPKSKAGRKFSGLKSPVHLLRRKLNVPGKAGLQGVLPPDQGQYYNNGEPPSDNEESGFVVIKGNKAVAGQVGTRVAQAGAEKEKGEEEAQSSDQEKEVEEVKEEEMTSESESGVEAPVSNSVSVSDLDDIDISEVDLGDFCSLFNSTTFAQKLQMMCDENGRLGFQQFCEGVRAEPQILSMFLKVFHVNNVLENADELRGAAKGQEKCSVM